MTVHKKLMTARCQLLLAKLEKTGKNSFQGYRYFELGDFLPAVQLIFEKVGLCGVVSYGTDFATLTITDVDDGTMVIIQSPMATASLKGAHEIQNLGAVETYQRRYLWMTAMELVENDPIDSAPPLVEPPKKKDYKVENPKPTLYKDSKEFPGLKEIGVADPMVEWEIKITKDASNDDWKEMVMGATKTTIELTQAPEDVQSIYRVNKTTYERLKTEFPTEFAELLDLFKAKKESFK
jgi:ERF superfamily